MVNPNAVNAETRVFRRRISANFSAFSAEFYVSRIPLNIRAFFVLTRNTVHSAATPAEIPVQYQCVILSKGALPTIAP